MSHARSTSARRQSNVFNLQKRIEGELRKHIFTVSVTPSAQTKGKCGKCGGRVIRSRTTGRLHSNCFTCRYLVMIYGSSIVVTRRDD